MTFMTGSRDQISLLPASIEDYIYELHPVRAYDAFVESLNFFDLNIQLINKSPGQAAYNPKSMLKLLLYGYSYGWRSSRKLERAVHSDLSFIWLMGGLKPDHRTIARFRKDNVEVLKKIMIQCAKICINLNLIEGNTLFLDGTKIRAAASINQTKTKEKLELKLTHVKERIDEIIRECNEKDENESEFGSYIEMPQEFKDKKLLKSKIEEQLAVMDIKKVNKLNFTDNDSSNMKGRQGIHACYNAQIVVDGKNGIIIHSDVVNENNDLNQFSNQISKANEILEKNCESACADSGYSNTENVKEILDKGIMVVVPTQKQAIHNPKEDPFGKDKFTYNEEQNCYYCPEGKELHYAHFSKEKNHFQYRITNPSNCIECRHYGTCTKNKRGRAVIRLLSEKKKEQLKAIYKTEKGQKIYKKRKTKVELPFGHIKRNLNGWQFLLRGLNSVKGEMSIFCLCFNIARMITITGGVSSFVRAIG